MAQEKILGVLGGMGPMASAYFYELVTAHTQVAQDQDHIEMMISSKTTTPDRTAYILGQSKESPYPVMLEQAKKLLGCGVQVIAIACNTSHHFHSRLQQALPQLQVLDMVGDTVARIKQMGSRKVGILATDGTVQVGIYQKACEAIGLPWAVPNAEGQRAVMQVIYEDIKRGLPPDMAVFNRAAAQLFAAGCDAVILGCTELSLLKKDGMLDKRYVDSMEVLADAAIRACGKQAVGFSWELV